LDVRDRVARVGLRTGVLRLGPLAEERRQRDRSQDADDQHNDEELDQGETLLVLGALTELLQHLIILGIRWACLLAPDPRGNAAELLCEPRWQPGFLITRGPWLCVPPSRAVCRFHPGSGDKGIGTRTKDLNPSFVEMDDRDRARTQTRRARRPASKVQLRYDSGVTSCRCWGRRPCLRWCRCARRC